MDFLIWTPKSKINTKDFDCYWEVQMFWYMVWNILITFYNLINCSKSILQFNQKIYKYICDQQTLEIYQNAPRWIQTFKYFLGCHPFWKRAHGLVSGLWHWKSSQFDNQPESEPATNLAIQKNTKLKDVYCFIMSI